MFPAFFGLISTHVTFDAAMHHCAGQKKTYMRDKEAYLRLTCQVSKLTMTTLKLQTTFNWASHVKVLDFKRLDDTRSDGDPT
jgi:hypothetical protein